MIFRITFFLIPMLLCCQCAPEVSEERATPPPGTPAKEVSNSTAQMIKLTEEASSKVDPMRVPYLKNNFRAEAFKKYFENATTPVEKMKFQHLYGYELLKAGRSEAAIQVLEDLKQKMQKMKVQNSKIIKQVNGMLALSYIRLGEQNNCISRYRPGRCIMPFEGEGIYEMKSSMRTAIGLYEEILKSDPDDYEAMWMLNFAYMSLGEFPEKVPEKWRLNEEEFRSDLEIPRFPNIAHTIGINTLGLSGGTCVDDFDGDGLLDIFASSWGFDDQIRFYKNEGDGTFSDRTEASGLAGIYGGLNIAHADYDNDGWLDLLILRGAWFAGEGKIPNSLLHNNGDGTFTDVTQEAGLLSFFPTQTATWTDFNLDGHLDLFIGNESVDQNSLFPCELYMNNGDGTFTNRIEESGLQNIMALTKGVAAGDVNNDGWPDLYLSFLNAKNRLFLNNGVYSEGMVSFSDSPAKDAVGEPVISFPCWFWDFNNDGWEDIFVASFGFSSVDGEQSVAAAVAAKNYRGERAGGNPRLYKNNGDGSFSDMTEKAGLTDGSFAMGSNYGDIDNDGYLDFYLGTGEPSYTAVVPNKMFRNDQGKSFQDVTTAAGMGLVQKGHGVGFGDFDNDGDQDIFSVIGGAYEGDVFGDALFLNLYGNENNWVTLLLEGTQANRAAIGARVKLTVLEPNGNARSIYRTVSSGSSFGGNSLQLEIGIGEATQIKSIEVRWPDRQNSVETFEGVDSKKFVKIKQGSGKVEYLNRKEFKFKQSS